MKNQRNITDRKQLKTFFKKGSLPDESAFEKLIDSTFNKADDKLDINEDGLMIYPSDDEERLLSFFEDKDDSSAKWVMYISKKTDGGIYFSQLSNSDQNDNKTKNSAPQSALFLRKDGTVGIGTNNPTQKLDVKGIIKSTGRTGSYLEGYLPADGEWHNVFEPEALSGCNAYEIMAYAEGLKNEGKYSLMHAIALCTYGNSKPKITKTCAHHGLWWNKIDIRWESKPSRIEKPKKEGEKKIFAFAKWWKQFKSIWEAKDTLHYNLQLRTKSDYGRKDNKKNGKQQMISYKISVLWDKSFN